MSRGHKNSHNDLTYERVRELFDYNPKTGKLFWKIALSKRNNVGEEAGFLNLGRVKVGYNNTDYMAHRVVWLWMTGEWPKKEIDHKNRIKSDNRWDNLREATSSQNQLNKGLQRNNSSGHQGVCFATRDKLWLAYTRINQKQIIFGRFRTKEEAVAARQGGMQRLVDEEWASSANHHHRP